MEQENQQTINTENKSYVLMTSEWFGCKSPRYSLVRTELREEKTEMLFLLGIDGIMISTKYANVPRKDITTKLFGLAVEAINDYLNENGVKKGAVIYGEYRNNETFELGIENPVWKDESWGQKVEDF